MAVLAKERAGFPTMSHWHTDFTCITLFDKRKGAADKLFFWLFVFLFLLVTIFSNCRKIIIIIKEIQMLGCFKLYNV